MASTNPVVVTDRASFVAALRRVPAKKRRKRFRVAPPPSDVIATYYAVLAKRFRTIVERAVRAEIVPMLRLGGLRATAARADAKRPTAVELRGTTSTTGAVPADVSERLGTVIGRTRVAWGDIRTLTPIAEQASKRTAKRTGDVFRKTMRTVLGIQPEIAEPWLAPKMTRWVQENVDLIVTIPEPYFASIEEKVREGFRQGLRHEVIADAVEEDYLANGQEAGQAKRRAALVARDQVQKLAGDIASQRQTSLGITRYVWRSSGEQRVRLTHRARDGQTFSWGPIEPQLAQKGLDVDKIDGHPGRPINCRCTAEPDIDGLLAELE